MPHRDPVGDGDGVEPARHPAARDHPGARRIGLRIERGVARRAVVARAGEPDERLGDVLLGDTHRVIVTAVRGTLGTDGDMPARQTRFVETLGHGDRLFPVLPVLRNPIA